jgi:NMD protein affecting ribosome stability and mRNA decay
MVISFQGNSATIMAMDNYENFEEKIEKLPRSVKEGQGVKGFLYEDRNYYLTLVESDDI